MTNVIKLATAGALAALLSSTPALAQMAWEDEGWDADGDGLFSVEEFRQGFRERINFADWDADADGLLSEDEFGGGIYDRYDVDATGAFEDAEYGVVEEDFGTEGVWRFRGEELVADPGEEVAAEAGALDGEGLVEADGLVGAEAGLEGWDVDGDGVLLRDEFQDGFREWGTFGEFDVDADGGLTEDELTDGIFTRYDDDGTGFIEEPELTDIGDDMGDEGFFDV